MDNTTVLILAGLGLIVIAVVVMRSRQRKSDYGTRQGPYVAPTSPVTKPSAPQPDRPGQPSAPPAPAPSPPPQQAPDADSTLTGGASKGIPDLDLEAYDAEEMVPEQKKGGPVGSVIGSVVDAIKDVIQPDEEPAPEPKTSKGRKRRESAAPAEETIGRRVSDAPDTKDTGANRVDDAKLDLADEPAPDDGFGGYEDGDDDELMEGSIAKMEDTAPEEAPPQPPPPPKPTPVVDERDQAEEAEEVAPEPEPEKEAKPEAQPQTEVQDDPVQFSAYYPREAQPETRYGLYVYAHLEALTEAVSKDVEKFKDELGGEVEKPKVAKQTPRLKRDTAVTVTPECEELTFDPPSLTKSWQGDWTRYGFDFRPDAAQLDETLFIRVSIQVSGVEIAHIKCALDVVATAEPINPLKEAQLQVQQGDMYEKIFISYSRDDKVVAENYRLAQIARGDDVFMDTHSIRAGENWQAALANAIDEVDIFQLFWSEHSAESKYVRYEWEYAMKYRCPDSKCAAFIRPVYWTKPLPTPPPELGHLNFRFVPLKDPAK